MTVKQAEKLLKSIGFIEVSGGKGSHRKFSKAGERPITLPSHNKEISMRVEDTLKKALRKYRGK
ncbi:toxin-antitoxin system, toxin component [Enterococcus sp. JM9B]|nr:toxin-antitoxin system, toxin component [Enterococcus sp. JM9B]